MGSYFSRRYEKDFTGPVKYMYENYGTESIKFVATWIKLTSNDGPLKFPPNGTFDRTRLENLKERLCTQRDSNKHFNALRLWRDESRRRNAESQIASLADQNKKLIAQLKEQKDTTQTKTQLDDELNKSTERTITNKTEPIKKPLSS